MLARHIGTDIGTTGHNENIIASTAHSLLQMHNIRLAASSKIFRHKLAMPTMLATKYTNQKGNY